MNNIDKLETSVQKLIHQYGKLAVLKEKAFKDIDNVKKKLNDAQETIRKLNEDSGNEGKKQKNIVVFEKNKEEIIKKIEFIIARLDNLNIDKITNDIS